MNRHRKHFFYDFDFVQVLRPMSSFMSDYVREAATLIFNFSDRDLNYETFEFTTKDVEKWWVLGSSSTTGRHLLEGHMYEPFPYCFAFIEAALKHLETLQCIARTTTSDTYRFLKQDAHNRGFNTRFDDARRKDNLGVVELHRIFEQISDRTKMIPKVEITEYHEWQKETETVLTFTTNIKHEPVELPKMTQFKDCHRGYISCRRNEQNHETVYSFPIPYSAMQFPFPVHSNKTLYVESDDED